MPNGVGDRTCPNCGGPYLYRLPNKAAYRFHVANEYRCDPRQHPYVYFHQIPTEQAVEIVYGRGASP